MRKRDGKSRLATVPVLLMATMLAVLMLSFDPSLAQPQSTTRVDIFTQKILFAGTGPNQPSDVFGPQEQVILYALVVFNDIPRNETLVTYEINGPAGRPQELKFFQTAITNVSGVARTVFSLASINETESFGTWTASASVEIEGNVYVDQLTFQVNWLVELLSVRMLDENLSSRNHFGNGGYIGYDIILRNNAMTKKVAFIKITVFDELHVPMNSSKIDNLLVPPDKRTQYVFGNLFLPKFAVPGKALITIAAVDGRSISYCPQVSADFLITTETTIFPNFTDAFVYTECAPMRTAPGNEVTITTLVMNQGTVVLSNIQVQVYLGSSLVDSRVISSLDSYQVQAFNINWKTGGLAEGIYNITAQVQTFPNEADLTDNAYSCQVELTTAEQEIFHDIEVNNVESSKLEALQGDTVDITVVVRNNGNVAESTNVTVYYNESLIERIHVTEFAPGAQRVLVFQWNTAGVQEGTYKIIGAAEPVPEEVNTENNVYHDGIVTVIRLLHPARDVAVTALSAVPTVSEEGLPIIISATVGNLGNESESFTLQVFYDDFPITSVDIHSLAPETDQNVSVVWNTIGVMPGNYTLKAYIPPLPGEENIANNLYVDGTIWVKGATFPGGFYGLIVFFGGLVLIASLLLLLLCLSKRRRRRKIRKQAFYTVVAHPHI